MATETLPEGTDAIVPGAAATDADDDFGAVESASGATSAADPTGGAGDDGFGQPTISDRIQGFKGQAGDKARDYASQGRDKAAEALDNLVRMIEDAAQQIDDKVGSQYGDYARQGAQTLAGVSGQIRDKDIDELFDDARRLVANSPGIAVATAATIGFVIARLARAGFDGNGSSGGSSGASGGSSGASGGGTGSTGGAA